MKSFFVSYDLVAPGRDYTSLYSALHQLGAKRVLQSQWVLWSSSSAVELRDHLRQFIDSNDRLLVNDFDDWASYNLMIKLTQAA